jgi:uridine phosphorylase
VARPSPPAVYVLARAAFNVRGVPRPPIHLRPATELAERVLLPGDPHRALAVAQDILDEPRMFNHARGLWGYTGRAPDGRPLTVQSTGMGGPSAAVVVEELIALGAQTLVRIGTCGALEDGFELGELVTVGEVLTADGLSASLEAGPRLIPDPALTAALAAVAAPVVTAVSTDLFYDPRVGVEAEWRAAGAQVVEMEAATVLALAARHGVASAVVLAVSDLLADGARRRIGREALEAAGIALGRAGYGALAEGATQAR